MQITTHANYALIGRWLGRREICKEIGYPVYNDAGDLWLVSDGGFCSFRHGEIKYLYVCREYRGSGLAYALTGSALDTHNGEWSVRSNRNSERLFLTFGFKPVSSTKNFTLMRRE